MKIIILIEVFTNNKVNKYLGNMRQGNTDQLERTQRCYLGDADHDALQEIDVLVFSRIQPF